MKKINLLTILLAILLISCNEKSRGKAFRIYHLKPNKVYVTPDNKLSFGEFSKRRSDFFVVKNYDMNNEQHKIKIDSFVVNYIDKDSFLIQNKNVNWRLVFFKYGDGIDENTTHQYDTDYTIHNLFSCKKELASFYFDTRNGYESSNYNITSEKSNRGKRKIISDHFNSNTILKEKIKQEQDARGSFKLSTYKQDTIKVLAKFIKIIGGNKTQIVQYKFLESITRLLVLEGDTLNVAYSNVYERNEFPEKSILTLVKDKGRVDLKNHYIFPDYNPEKGIEELINKNKI